MNKQGLVVQEMGASFKVGDIPADLADSAAEWREKLLEQVAEMDDDVMEKYLDVSLCHTAPYAACDSCVKQCYCTLTSACKRTPTCSAQQLLCLHKSFPAPL